MKKSKLIRSIFCWLALLPILIPILLPPIVAFLTAFKPRNELTQIPPAWFPSEFQWQNLINLWKEVDYLSALLNSLWISSLTTIVAIVVAVPGAYALNRYDFRGKNAYRFFLLSTQMLSPIVVVLGLFRVIVFLGLVDSISFLPVIYAAFNVAFCVWMLQSYFATISKDLEESARLEGAGFFRSLLTIFMPLAIPAVSVVAMFTFINSWNEFVIALSILRKSEAFTIQLKIIEMTGYYNIRWDYIMLSVIIGILPVAAMFAWLQKYLIGGLTAGAVK